MYFEMEKTALSDIQPTLPATVVTAWQRWRRGRLSDFKASSWSYETADHANPGTGELF
jgi:hypothetical protein